MAAGRDPTRRNRRIGRPQLVFSEAWGRIAFDVRWRSYAGPAVMLDALVTEETARRRQLHFTLPHEVGHWIDRRQRVLDPARSAADPASEERRLAERWRARPHREREDLAHRYAESVRPLLADHSEKA
jgi:hypothetical protein